MTPNRRRFVKYLAKLFDLCALAVSMSSLHLIVLLLTPGNDARRFYGDANQAGKLSGVRAPSAHVAQPVHLLRTVCFEEVDNTVHANCGSIQSYDACSGFPACVSKSSSSGNREPEICLDVLAVEHLHDGCRACRGPLVASRIAESRQRIAGFFSSWARTSGRLSLSAKSPVIQNWDITS